MLQYYVYDIIQQLEYSRIRKYCSSCHILSTLCCTYIDHNCNDGRQNFYMATLVFVSFKRIHWYYLASILPLHHPKRGCQKEALHSGSTSFFLQPGMRPSTKSCKMTEQQINHIHVRMYGLSNMYVHVYVHGGLLCSKWHWIPTNQETSYSQLT